MKRNLITIIMMGFVLLSGPAYSCDWKSNYVSTGSQAKPKSMYKKINHFMLVPFIIDEIGPAKRDTGKDVHVLEWDVLEGGVFIVKAANACGKPYEVGFRD